MDLHYLKLLSKTFPDIATASTEIINLEAILNLPKGTEHFLTDLHGEDAAFHHVLKNASGVIRRKVEDLFGHSILDKEKKELCTLIYYPREKLALIRRQNKDKDLALWYEMTIIRLMKVCGTVSSKYTRSKVRKALPQEFSYIIQELLQESLADVNKHDYLSMIISSIVSTGRAEDFIIAVAEVIQRFTIDRLHIIGDIYDRGPGAHIIMDTLCQFHQVDIQWGNHDLLWMGAASGNAACMAAVLRISLRYGNLKTLEAGYGINLLPLATFAMDTYGDDPCTAFLPKLGVDSDADQRQVNLIARMHKAITIIQLKLESQLILRNRQWEMDDRLMLDKINLSNGTVHWQNGIYPLTDSLLPTLDPANPFELTAAEQEVCDTLMFYFKNSEKLQRHVQFLYAKGSMYLICNDNLLFHGSMPLNEDGSFRSLNIQGQSYCGRALFDRINQLAHNAYFGAPTDEDSRYALDFMWYLWCGPGSPSFDKDRMTTFERYFIADRDTYRETKGFYYILKDRRDICERILNEFGITSNFSHIINGHIPVKAKSGESPIKGQGKLLVIDGGYARVYQKETGIGGYTLIYNSHGLQLVQHEPFVSKQKAVEEGLDIISETQVVDFTSRRRLVRDTDIGRDLHRQVCELRELLSAYRQGLL